VLHNAAVTGVLLGGEWRPAGVTVSYLRCPAERVVEFLTSWRRDLGQELLVEPTRFDSLVEALEPFESPWTHEVLFDCGEWTAYLNNDRYGGDTTAAAPHLSRALGIECFIATNAPRYGPGHAQTGLSILGPSGVPPLMMVRSVVAHTEDGRSSWRLEGPEQPFERSDRYRAPRVRDRFDRALLIEYLGAVGIRADDEAFYGDGVRVRQLVDYPRMQMTAREVRESLGW
jgi:hypothetical protein